MSNSLRIIFAGTPDFAARHLQALLDAGHQVVAVYTQPDRPAGRGQQLQASPVKQLAVAKVCLRLGFFQRFGLVYSNIFGNSKLLHRASL